MDCFQSMWALSDFTSYLIKNASAEYDMKDRPLSAMETHVPKTHWASIKGQVTYPLQKYKSLIPPKKALRRQFGWKLICPLAEIQKVFTLHLSCSRWQVLNPRASAQARGTRKPTLSISTSRSVTVGTAATPRGAPTAKCVHRNRPVSGLGIIRAEGVTDINLRLGKRKAWPNLSWMRVSRFPLAASNRLAWCCKVCPQLLHSPPTHCFTLWLYTGLFWSNKVLIFLQCRK